MTKSTVRSSRKHGIKIRSRLSANHNESALTLKVRSRLSANHNETILQIKK